MALRLNTSEKNEITDIRRFCFAFWDLLLWVLGSSSSSSEASSCVLSSLSSVCQLSAVLIVVFCVAAVVAAAVRAVGPFRRVRGQALLPLAPHVMPRCS